MEIINIDGKKIIELLNSIDENINDNKYKFEYVEQQINNNRLTLKFTIISNVTHQKFYKTIHINSDGDLESYDVNPLEINNQCFDIEAIVNLFLLKNKIDLKNNTIDKYYTIKQLIEILSLSRSQIYKLLKNKSGIIDKGDKKYNEDVLISLISRIKKYKNYNNEKDITISDNDKIELKRNELFEKNGGKIIDGVKYPYNSINNEINGKRELNALYLNKRLRAKYKEYKETERKKKQDEIFEELIKNFK
jgi:hypothetical protein